MTKLKEEQLRNIEGGSATGLVLLGIIAIGTIITGIFDGIVRPLSCHE